MNWDILIKSMLEAIIFMLIVILSSMIALTLLYGIVNYTVITFMITLFFSFILFTGFRYKNGG